MAEKERSARVLELVAGWLCLDFAKTVSTRLEGGREYLASYVDLVAWSQHAGILADEAGDLLPLDQAARHPDLAAAVLERSITVRETIYRVFSVIAAGREPRAAELAALNAELGEALSWLEIAPSGGRFEWRWTTEGNDLERMLWPVARRPGADMETNSTGGKKSGGVVIHQFRARLVNGELYAQPPVRSSPQQLKIE